MRWNVTDAYAHVGLPRFGSLGQLLRYMNVQGIRRSVAVLGPRVPDIATLSAAAAAYPDRLRCVGIPFGETVGQRLKAVTLQLDLGAMGIRLDQREAMDNPAVLEQIGRRGRVAYAIDACRNQRIAGMYMEWLATYPTATVVAPHFMYAAFLSGSVDCAGGSIAELMLHPRFHGILVRNLGMCGSVPPHDEYKPWLEYVLEHCGPERLMWGSEYPVLFWRNERAEAAVELFRKLLAPCSDEQFARIAGGNAEQLFFSEDAPPCEKRSVPVWIEEQFERNRSIPLVPRGVELPVDVYEGLLDSYMRSAEFEQGMSLADYILRPWKQQG